MNTLAVLAALVVWLGLSVRAFEVWGIPYLGWALLILVFLWLFLLIDTAWEEATGGDSPFERVRHRLRQRNGKQVRR